AVPQSPLPSYKQRVEEFKRLFKELPDSEILILYPCALHRDILLQGRLYLSENWICFYSYVFRGTKITLSLKDITTMSREKTARLIPNAIQICTHTEKYFFASFSAREKSYLSVFRIWQNTLLDKLWQMIKQHYGYDLGLNNEEMESLQLQDESLNTPSLHRTPTLPLERHLAERLAKCSTQSLDLNANENLLEQSGSETNEEEDRMDKSEEPGRLYLNKVFHMSASKMFALLFTDSSFTQRFMEIRRITDPSSTAWQKDDSGNDKRVMNYTITINNPLIGKFSTATENQTLSKESREGQYYQVDAVVHTHDVPYHDHFYTQNRYYIIRVSKRKCRLVYSDVKYSKPTFGLIKTFITKNSWSGIEDYFRQLAELLEEEAEMNQAVGESGKAGLRRRRRTFSRTLLDHGKPGKQSVRDPDDRDGNMPQRWSTTAIVLSMSVLLILMVVNLGLFFKLWAMEDVAHRMYLTTKHRLRERMETMQLLKTVLQDSILLLEQLRTSLVVLQQNF
uniref:GRAM domain containing 1c n=1 Tax=Xiphophorus couchianus TaxID=32473 RepID=A0A3B5LXP4_9TELE